MNFSKLIYVLLTFFNKMACYTPLFLACKYGELQTVTQLLNNGYDVNVCDINGLTLLHIASWNNQVEIVDMLLKHGATFDKINLNIQNHKGETPLHLACLFGHIKIVHLLLREGIDLTLKDCNGFTALHNACNNGHLLVVKALLDWANDTNISIKNDETYYGSTPLYLASQNGHVKIILEFIKERIPYLSEIKSNHELDTT
jgi:ankyrin repeat protein